jgi:tRNA A-37 threonylcarbamoyl transferase component Bud32
MAPCPYCGTELDDGARFCGVCGKPITTTAARAPARASRPAAAETLARSGPRKVPTPAPAPAAKPDPATGAESPRPAPGSSASPVSPSSVSPSPVSASPVFPSLASPSPATSSGPADVSSASPAPAPKPKPKPPGGGLRRPAQPLENLIGQTLNHRYLVEDKVGEGGFGAVFRGKQIATGREVALKILHPHNVSDETIVARFRREAEACSKLRDPHTVTTYDFDETPDGILYLAMELLRGRSLHQLQKAEGMLTPARVLNILDQVAASLTEAHANGIVHRDMKPENVFIETRNGDDHVKVLDFGIAKVMSDDRQAPALTAVGQTLGTLEFMSPEQLRGQALDGRSDLYALGMMAYEMLTGTLPFHSVKSPIDIINFHMKQAPPAPSSLTDKVAIPPAIDAIILKMVAKDREQRFADAPALREEIARTQRALDRRPDRFEAYRVVGVIGATVALVATLLYFLHR